MGIGGGLGRKVVGLGGDVLEGIDSGAICTGEYSGLEVARWQLAKTLFVWGELGLKP